VAEQPLLDSDVLIDYLRGAGPGRDLVRSLASGSGYRVSAVSAFELALGRSYAQNPGPVDALLSAPVLDLTRAGALRGGALLAALRATGKPIDLRDAMQAGICLEADTLLVTRNTSHFERVPDLRLAAPSELL
jgi:tRNA(fMet)-specific endonuclease VapC